MALGSFVDERAVDALLDALKDDEWIAFSAIESLGKIGEKRAIPPLLDVFRNGSEEISLASCEVLMDFRDEAVLDEMLDMLKGLEQKKRDIYLKAILERGDEGTFQRAKERIGDELFIHLLNCIELEEKKSLNLLRMLVTFKTSEACEAVLNAIRTMNPEEEEYDESIHILLNLRKIWEKHVPEYMEKDERYVLPLIRACKMASVKTDEEALLKVFLSSPVEIKREIVKDIPVIVDGKGLSVIKEAMKDLDGHVKGDAMITAGMTSLDELKDEIEAALMNDFQDVRVKALNALIHLDLSSAMDFIKKFVQDGSGDDKRVYLAVAGLLTGESNFPFIKRLLSDNDEKVRGAAASTLGNFLDDERYMNIFVKQLKAKDIPHEVLKVIKEQRLAIFKDRLQDIFEDMGRGLWTRYYALTAMSSFEDLSLFDTFARGLEDQNNIIKIGCLKALSDLNDVRALNYIMPFVQSDDEDIRSTAEFVMNKLESF
jgi:HEAT repeat protein